MARRLPLVFLVVLAALALLESAAEAQGSRRSVRFSRTRASSIRSTRSAPQRASIASSAVRARVDQQVARVTRAPSNAEPPRRPAPARVSRERAPESVRRTVASLRSTPTGPAQKLVPSMSKVERRMSTGSMRSDRSVIEGARRRQSAPEAGRGRLAYPPNRGFQGTPKEVTLAAGTRIDRYGYEGGRFTSPGGTPYPNRALPVGTDRKPLTTYEVVRPVVVKAGPAAPWFGQPGGGMQQLHTRPIRDLVAEGFLRRVPQ